MMIPRFYFLWTRACILLIAATLAPGPASAQIPAMPLFDQGKHGFALQLGLARPTATNGFDTFAKPGPSVGVQYLYYRWDWVAFGGEINYVGFGKQTHEQLVDGMTARFSDQSSALGAGAVLRVNLLRERAWTPYLLGGAGLHSFSIQRSVETPDVKGLASPQNSSGLALTGAAGLEAFLFRGMSLSLEARLQEFRLDSKSYGWNAQAVSCLLGIRFWLRDY